MNALELVVQIVPSSNASITTLLTSGINYRHFPDKLPRQSLTIYHFVFYHEASKVSSS